MNLYDPKGLQADRPKIITPPVTVVDSVTYLDTVMEFYNAEFGGFNGWTGGGGGDRGGAETPTGGGGTVAPVPKPESHDECVKRINAEQLAKLEKRGSEIHHRIYDFSKATAIIAGVFGAVGGGFAAGPAGAVAFGAAGAVVGFISPYPYGDIWIVGTTIGNIRETKKRIESECP